MTQVKAPKKHWDRLIVLITLLFTIAGCISEHENEQRVLVLDEYHKKLVVANKSDGLLTFYIDVNDRLLADNTDLVEAIKNMPPAYEHEGIHEKAWRFVVQNVTSADAITDEPWSHNPLITYNSVGFGLCDDLAYVLSSIWKLFGLKSRVWSLTGHAVPEVFINGRWEMYDPSFAVFYVNSNHQVSGVEELMKDPALIYQPIDTLPFSSKRSFLQNTRRYSEAVASLYQSDKDNAVVELPYDSTLIKNIQFKLPPGASIELPTSSPDNILIPTKFGKFSLLAFVKYTLPAGWHGTLDIPFVVAEIEGAGIITLGGVNYRIDEEGLNKHLSTFKFLYSQLQFVETNSAVEVYGLINPIIFNENIPDTVRISGVGISQLEVKAEVNEHFHWHEYAQFGDMSGISDGAWKYYSYLTKHMVELKLPIFVKNPAVLQTADVRESIGLVVAAMNGDEATRLLVSDIEMMYQWDAVHIQLDQIDSDKKLPFYNELGYFSILLSLLERGVLADTNVDGHSSNVNAKRYK